MNNYNWCNLKSNRLPNSSLEKEIVDVLFENNRPEEWEKLELLASV